MKFFHNSAIGKVLVIGFAVAVHGLFAVGAYYLGLFISSIILHDVPATQQAFALGFAALTFAGAMWAFVYNEYAREDVDAYSRMSGKNYALYLTVVQIAIGGAEMASLAFRCYQVHDLTERFIIASLGVLFLVIAFCLGKVIHAMANRPFEVAVQRARTDAGRSIVDDYMKYVPKMSTEQKTRFYNGDASPIDEVMMMEYDHQQEKASGKKAKETSRKSKAQQDEEERQKARGFVSSILEPKHDPHFMEAQMNNQASRLSGNGHQK